MQITYTLRGTVKGPYTVPISRYIESNLGYRSETAAAGLGRLVDILASRGLLDANDVAAIGGSYIASDAPPPTLSE